MSKSSCVSFGETSTRPTVVKNLQFHIVEATADDATDFAKKAVSVVIEIQDGQSPRPPLRSSKAKAHRLNGAAWNENLGSINLPPTATLIFRLRTPSRFGHSKTIAASETLTLEQLIKMQGRLDDRSLRLTLPLYHMSKPLKWGSLVLNLRRIIRDTPHEAKEQVREIQERRRSLGVPPIIITTSDDDSDSPVTSEEGLPLTPLSPLSPIPLDFGIASSSRSKLDDDNLISVEDRFPRFGDLNPTPIVVSP